MLRPSSILTLFLMSVSLSTAAAQQPTTLNQCTGTHQADLNACAKAQLNHSNKQLLQIYQEIIKNYRHNPLLLNRLKESQKAWSHYRDAQLRLLYPQPSDYATVFPLCSAQYLTKLTQERITVLKQWLLGKPEGDVCAGSIRIIRRI